MFLRRVGYYRLLSSPHTWGCFSFPPSAQSAPAVFPTYVGVFPMMWPLGWTDLSLPHIRGGVSSGLASPCSLSWSSPHTWGCFFCQHHDCPAVAVFPTYVGVFPSLNALQVGLVGLPHIRGGVSLTLAINYGQKQSSPHTWGCFQESRGWRKPAAVFPTYVGVFPCSH